VSSRTFFNGASGGWCGNEKSRSLYLANGLVLPLIAVGSPLELRCNPVVRLNPYTSVEAARSVDYEEVMSNARSLRETFVAGILEGEGHVAKAQRRAAFDNADVRPEPLRALVEKVARHAHAVNDADIVAARASGLSEDQLFELLICAAVGEATRQDTSARAALDAAIEKD
jgi:hypothetical protein